MGARADEHLDDVRRWFDGHVADWDNPYTGRPKGMVDVVLMQRMEVAIQHVLTWVPPGGRVLDAGCGTGAAAAELAARGYTLHAIDVAPAMIDATKDRFERRGIPAESHQLSVGDAVGGDVPPGAYDAVLALGFLQYQVDEGAALAALAELLRPGGILVISGPAKTTLGNGFGLRDAPWFRALKARLGWRPPATESTVSVHGYSLARFRQLLRGAGMSVIDRTQHGFGPIMVLTRLLPFRAELAIHRFLTRASTRTPLHRLGANLVVVARRDREH